MLVLSRLRDETVVLILPDGTELRAGIVDIRGDKVRLGFDAPRDVLVHREEVWQDMKREAKAAGMDPREYAEIHGPARREKEAMQNAKCTLQSAK